MLKGNLSTRPFYNDRLVTAAIVGFAILVALFTILNVTRLVGLLTDRAEIHARLDGDAAETSRINNEVAALQAKVDRPTLTRLADAAREANELIDLRTFSWTTLLGQLERTLPPDVRLTGISPRAQRGVFQISMAIVARDLDDIEEFVDALLDAGGFYDVAPVEQRANDDDTYQAVVQASYLLTRTAAAQRPSAAATSAGVTQP